MYNNRIDFLKNKSTNFISTKHFNKIVYESFFVYNYSNIYKSVILHNNIVTIKHINTNINKLITYSCGLNFTNNIYLNNGMYKLSFKAKSLNKCTNNKRLKLYNGTKYIFSEIKLHSEFQLFYFECKFTFNNPSKWRISLDNNESNNEYEIKDIFLREADENQDYVLNKMEDYIKVIFIIDNHYKAENIDFTIKLLKNDFFKALTILNENIMLLTYNQEKEKKFNIKINKKDILLFKDYVNTNFINIISNLTDFEDYLEMNYQNLDCNKIIIQNYESPSRYFDIFNKKIEIIKPTLLFTNSYWLNKIYSNSNYLGVPPSYNGPTIDYNDKKYFMAIQPIASNYNKERFFIIYNLIIELDKYITNNNLSNKLANNDIHFYGKSRQLSDFIEKIRKRVNNFIIKHETTNETTNLNIQSQPTRSIEKLNIYKDYKYNIALENLCTDFYFSEKLFDILYSNSITIYFGSPNIEYLYPELFQNTGVINGFKVFDVINRSFKKDFLDSLIFTDQTEFKRKLSNQHKLLDHMNFHNELDFWNFIFYYIDNIEKKKNLNIESNIFYLLNKKINNINENKLLENISNLSLNKNGTFL